MYKKRSYLLFLFVLTFSLVSFSPAWASDAASNLPDGVKTLVNQSITKYHGRKAGADDFKLFEKCYEQWKEKGKTDYQSYVENIVTNKGLDRGLGLLMANKDLKNTLKDKYKFTEETAEKSIKAALKKHNIALSEDDWNTFYKKKILTGIFNLTTDPKKFKNLSSLLTQLSDKNRAEDMLAKYGLGVKVASNDFSTIGAPDPVALAVDPDKVKLPDTLKKIVDDNINKYFGRKPSAEEYEYFRQAYCVWLAKNRKNYSQYINEIVTNSSGRGLKPGFNEVLGDDTFFDNLKEHFNFQESMAEARIRAALKKNNIGLSENDWDTFYKKKLLTGLFNISSDKKKYENLVNLLIQLESKDSAVSLLAKYGIGVTASGNPVTAPDAVAGSSSSSGNPLDAMDDDITGTPAATADAVEKPAADPAPAVADKPKDDPKPAADSNKVNKDGVVANTGGVGLRVRNNPWGAQVGGLPEGTKVKVLEKAKGYDGSVWYKLEQSKISQFLTSSPSSGAWCHSDYITLGASSSSGSSSSGGAAPKKDDPKSTAGKTDSKGRLKGAPGYEAALDWAQNGCKTTVNPNNGKKGTGAWAGYCLGHVARCWSIGAGKTIPQLQKYCAKDACNSIKAAGMMKGVPSSGPIPAGAPVFWDGIGDKGHKTWGHIAISTGKVDNRGVPTVVDTGTTPISVQPIDRYGKSDGYGVIKGTPLI